MKKLVLIFLVYIFVLTGCGNQVKPVPTPTKEQAAQIEQPTIEPTVIVTEAPIETAVPTEEPTTEPVEEQVDIEIPKQCPIESYQIPEDLADWTLDTGEYGVFGFKDISKRKRSYIQISGIGNILKQGDKEVSSFAVDGGTFSFTIPSSAILRTEMDLEIHVNDEDWTFDKAFASSPAGSYIIPAEAVVEITSTGGANPDAVILDVFFMSGNPIELVDIEVPTDSILTCNNLLWELTIENTNSTAFEVVVGSTETFFFVEEDTDGSILEASLLVGEDKVKMEMDFTPGMSFYGEKLSIVVKERTKIKFLFFIPFFRE